MARSRADAIAAMVADGIPAGDQTEAAICEYMEAVTDPFAGAAMPTPNETDADVTADEAALNAEAQQNTLPTQVAEDVAAAAPIIGQVAKAL